MNGTWSAKIAGSPGMSGARGRLAGTFRPLPFLLALFFLFLFALPSVAQAQQTSSERESSGDSTTIGATEQVVLVNEENGEEEEVLGRVDTGAFYTSRTYARTISTEGFLSCCTR